MIGCCEWGWDTWVQLLGGALGHHSGWLLGSRLARWGQIIGWCLWCHSDWAVIIYERLQLRLLWGTQAEKIWTTHNLCSWPGVNVGLTFQDQCLSRLSSRLYLSRAQWCWHSAGSTGWLCFMLFHLILSRLILSRPCLSRPLVGVGVGVVGSHLWWLVNCVSSWGTTRTESCYIIGNGSVHRV